MRQNETWWDLMTIVTHSVPQFSPTFILFANLLVRLWSGGITIEKWHRIQLSARSDVTVKSPNIESRVSQICLPPNKLCIEIKLWFLCRVTKECRNYENLKAVLNNFHNQRQLIWILRTKDAPGASYVGGGSRGEGVEVEIFWTKD